MKALVLSRTQTTQRSTAIGFAILASILLLVSSASRAYSAAPDSFADLAEQVSPAVVNITTSTTVATSAGEAPTVPEGSPFEDFFRDFMERQGPGNNNRPQRRSQALGSGFVISEDGFIVTNNHVIEGADEILIEFFSGEELPAELIGTDPNTDIALLKVNSDDPLPFVSFGDSDLMRVGDWVLAVGNPLGQGFSVSAGIVSARNRTLSGSYDDFIQTDAAINRGNSGGPLFNLDGDVIGVNTAILSPNGGSIGLGFSMASKVVTRVVDQLQEFGETRRGWLGVRIQPVSEDVAEAIGMDDVRGALVTDVMDGPSKEAGLLAGDVIVTFDGQDIADPGALVRVVGGTDVGKSVRVVVFRDGETQTFLVTLGRREEAEAAMPAAAEPQAPAELNMFGMVLSELDDTFREQLGLSAADGGLIVKDVEVESSAYAKGIRAGDLVAEAGQQSVATVEDFSARVEAAKEAGRKSLLLLVRREGEPRFVALSLE